MLMFSLLLMYFKIPFWTSFQNPGGFFICRRERKVNEVWCLIFLAVCVFVILFSPWFESVCASSVSSRHTNSRRNFSTDRNTNFLPLCLGTLEKLQLDSGIVGQAAAGWGIVRLLLWRGHELVWHHTDRRRQDGWCEFGLCILYNFCCCLFLCRSHCCLQLHRQTHPYNPHWWFHRLLWHCIDLHLIPAGSD